MKTPTFAFAALLLMLLVSGISSKKGGSKGDGGSSKENHSTPTPRPSQTPITVQVDNAGANPPMQTYSTTVVFRGILLGALRRLQTSNVGFNFTYTEDPNYGPFLESVNGVFGNVQNRTYWELQVKANKKTTKPDVGIGCYIPKENDLIILKYSTY
ncbi:transcobalamin-1-like [Parambassis ranga]|uniref:Transcobalamin-1-like n=1 Tax=Parambassis ranga TaxID=210632 RepID=A0A6P7JF97_9TELE|nr:transcobalamin-1-like [Parambassis ranga]